MTNSERSSGVRRPFRGGVISRDEPCPRDEDLARGRGVVFRGGDLDVLGKRESPPGGPFDDIVSFFPPLICRLEYQFLLLYDGTGVRYVSRGIGLLLGYGLLIHIKMAKNSSIRQVATSHERSNSRDRIR